MGLFDPAIRAEVPAVGFSISLERLLEAAA